MAATITIRKAVRGDLTAIDAVLSRAFPALLKEAYPPSVMVTAVPLLSRANPRLVNSGRYLVAEEDGQVVGAGGWSATRRHKTAEVRHLASDPRRVRHGIGSALLAHLTASARAAGMREFVCFSTRNAVCFYAACGFEIDGPVEIDLRPGIVFPAVRMHRAL